MHFLSTVNSKSTQDLMKKNQTHNSFAPQIFFIFENSGVTWFVPLSFGTSKAKTWTFLLSKSHWISGSVQISKELNGQDSWGCWRHTYICINTSAYIYIFIHIYIYIRTNTHIAQRTSLGIQWTAEPGSLFIQKKMRTHTHTHVLRSAHIWRLHEMYTCAHSIV